MPEQIVEFKNFAKLENTKLAFNDITVIAGKPGTGKSYIMKFMYAWNEAISQLNNKTYLMHYALMDGDEKTFKSLEMLKSLIKLVNEKDDDYKNILELIDDGRFVEAEKKAREIGDKKANNDLNSFLIDTLNNFAERQQKALTISNDEVLKFLFRNILRSIFGEIDQISERFEFRSSSLELSYKKGSFDINYFSNSDDISSSIFVETPLILEFEKFLPRERFKVPYHIDSLLGYLREKNYSFISDEGEGFVQDFKEKIKKIIKGDISRNSSGFEYISNNGKKYDAINISSGTKSIGLLCYLVENRALKKGSVLYWEEPEVHLHPEWQLKMIELFIKLLEEGIKIIFSTHSPYMCDYLNAISIKNNFRDRISFNLLKESKEKVDSSTVDNMILKDNNNEDWNKIQKELFDPLEEIMWEYI